MTTAAASKQIIAPALRAMASVHVSSSVLPASLSRSSAAYLSSAAPPGGKAALPDLPYDYAALSPAISAETMEIHHSKHHNAYVTNLNVALEKLDAAVSVGDVSSIIGLQGALKFNGGGHLNHSLFWENLCAKGSSAFPTTGPLADAIAARFGDVEAMKKEMSALCVGVQGSGWGWLGYDAKTGALFRRTTREGGWDLGSCFICIFRLRLSTFISFFDLGTFAETVRACVFRKYQAALRQ
jgi:Fe-Mn family superoxide dismutase